MDPIQSDSDPSNQNVDGGFDASDSAAPGSASDVPPPQYIPEPALDEVMDEFDEADFDHEFDDDFEEEITGEYDLQDDQYGQEFNEQFGHLTPDQEAEESDSD